MTVSVPMQRRAPVAPQLVVVNGGERCPTGAQIRPLSWSFSYCRWSRGWVGPNFQAGYAGSIPFTRSTVKLHLSWGFVAPGGQANAPYRPFRAPFAAQLAVVNGGEWCPRGAGFRRLNW